MTPWVKKYKLSRKEVAKILDDFLKGEGRPLAWDGFTLGMSFEDEDLERIRITCANLSQDYPPRRPNEYCSEEGRKVIRKFIEELRRSG